MNWEDTIPQEGYEAYLEWKARQPSQSQSDVDVCLRCGDKGTLPDGNTCPDCCPHNEHDHGICLECGKDIMDDLVGRAELLGDE